MNKAKQILLQYERETTFNDSSIIDRIITISQGQVEQLEKDILWALRDIGQFDSNLERLYEGDKLDLYLIDNEFDKSELVAINAVIEYDVEYAQYIARKDTIIMPFIEYHYGNYRIYRKGSIYNK